MESLKELNNVIEKFKNRSDVINGDAIGWKPNGIYSEEVNRPTNVGTGLTTTGWCVSASEAFNDDPAFEAFKQIYGSYSRLVSIDIKEQFHGYCYNGSQNKWHTAILLNLGTNNGIDVNYIVDLTCGQFGNEFVNKNIWTVEAWMNKFRSKLCQHKVLDRLGNPLSIQPMSQSVPSIHETLKSKYNLKSFIGLDERERTLLMNFMQKFHEINNKILIGTIKPNEIEMINEFIDIYSKKANSEYKIPIAYTTLLFNNKDAAFNWLDNMLNLTLNDGLTNFDFECKQNLMLFETIESAKKHFDLVEGKLTGERYLLNIEFKNITAFKGFSNIKSYLLFIGTMLNIKLTKGLFKKEAPNECLITFNGI